MELPSYSKPLLASVPMDEFKVASKTSIGKIDRDFDESVNIKSNLLTTVLIFEIIENIIFITAFLMTLLASENDLIFCDYGLLAGLIWIIVQPLFESSLVLSSLWGFLFSVITGFTMGTLVLQFDQLFPEYEIQLLSVLVCHFFSGLATINAVFDLHKLSAFDFYLSNVSAILVLDMLLVALTTLTSELQPITEMLAIAVSIFSFAILNLFVKMQTSELMKSIRHFNEKTGYYEYDESIINVKTGEIDYWMMSKFILAKY